MKRITILSLVVLTVLLAACGQAPTAAPQATVEAPPAVVSASGKVLPERWAALSFPVGGQVVAVNVQIGDSVKAGDVLIQLDDADASLAVAQAQAAVAAAQAQRDLLVAAPRPEQLEVARTAISITQAALAGAQADLNRLSAGANVADIATAEAALARAQAEQQAAYEAHEQTMKCYEVTQPGGGTEQVCPTLGTLEEQARANLQAADQAVAAAQAQLNRVYRGASRDEINGSQSRVAAAQAQVEQAQAQYALLDAGVSGEQVAAADAGVAQAQVALEAAQAQLLKLQLLAPFDGVVGVLQARSGEWLAPGQPVVTIGDLSTLRVETTDLSEVDVARVRDGQPVKVTFDALPGVTVEGKVMRIAPMATPGQSGVNYMVIVQLSQMPQGLRWGMTAFVDVQIQ